MTETWECVTQQFASTDCYLLVSQMVWVQFLHSGHITTFQEAVVQGTTSYNIIIEIATSKW